MSRMPNNLAKLSRGALKRACCIDGVDYDAVLNLNVKKLAATALFISMLLVALSGCGSPGPSPEQQARDSDQQREAARQQADFRKSLPPVSNPGQGWRD